MENTSATNRIDAGTAYVNTVRNRYAGQFYTVLEAKYDLIRSAVNCGFFNVTIDLSEFLGVDEFHWGHFRNDVIKHLRADCFNVYAHDYMSKDELYVVSWDIE